MKLVSKDDLVKSSKQIKKIEDFYPRLVRSFAELLKANNGKTIRDIDREYFIRELDYDSLESKE